jgi:hypothetical protein
MSRIPATAAPSRAPGTVSAEELRSSAPSPLLTPQSAPITVLDEDAVTDLGLDRILTELGGDRSSRNSLAAQVREVMRRPLPTAAAVRARQAVFADLESAAVRQPIEAFCAGMEQVASALAAHDAARSEVARRRWYLEAADRYCTCVTVLVQALPAATLQSAALRDLHRHACAHAQSPPFTALAADVASVAGELADLEYGLIVSGGAVRVHRLDSESDHGAEIAVAFARLTADHDEPRPALRRPAPPELNHVQIGIVERVARFFPEPFAALRAVVARGPFVDATLASFARDVQVLLVYLRLMDRLRTAGLPFTLPAVTEPGGDVHVRDAYDLALGAARTAETGRVHVDAGVVLNDVELAGAERFLVVTGPNQGGKTTYARLVGQLHHLAAIGFPVPAREAQLPLVDTVRTVFERGENLAELTGKLADDLHRIRAVLDTATPATLVVLNELFTSTTAADATDLGTRVLARLVDAGCRGVYVTFLDELAALPGTVSVVGEVDAHDLTRRTFRLTRRPADGRAYAHALAAAHGLDRAGLTERIRRPCTRT